MTQLKIALLCCVCLAIAIPAQAQTHVIGVSKTDGPPPYVDFVHFTGHGYRGHIIAATGDLLKWSCFLGCTQLSVTILMANKLCAGGPMIQGSGTPLTATCQVNASYMAPVEYTISVDGVSADPYIIVDNGRMLGGKGKKPDKDQKR